MSSERTASGLWHLRSVAPGSVQSGEIDAVLTLPSERYAAAVLAAEAAPEEPAASLRALAVVVRTYALNGPHTTALPGHLPAALCDSTACQAMRLGPIPAVVEEAARDTAGETLWFRGRRAQAFFAQHCGGLTEDAGTVWPALHGLPYLRSHPDPYCVRHDAAAWHATLSLTQLSGIAQAEGWHLPAHMVAVRVGERSAAGRVRTLVFTGEGGHSASVAGSALRLAVGRALGWNRLRSDAYEVSLAHGDLSFDGRGHGHGVGLCQTGAAMMAAEGRSTAEILRFYFPGATVGITAADEGWRRTAVGPMTVRSTEPLTPERRAVLLETWVEAQRRFPPRRVMAPELTFAPSTELFRQLTGEPGWALAATRGRSTVLQPEAVLRAHGPMSALLLHEMLHLLIEDEASARTPLWSREGLVEVLAGDNVASVNAASEEAIDRALLHAASLAESQRAHRAAALRVQTLVARYGFSTVRGWLTSGVPTGVVSGKESPSAR